MELPDVCWVGEIACVILISVILSFLGLSVSHLSTLPVSRRSELQGVHVPLCASMTSRLCGEGYYDFTNIFMHPGVALILNWRMCGTQDKV